MIATNGGCVGHRNVIDAVDFAVTQKQQHPSKRGGTPKNGTSRSDRLRNKSALLYNKKSRNPIIHDKRRPDDADWGVQPKRRGTATPVAITPTTSNKSTTIRSSTRHKSPKRSILQVANTTPRSSEGGGLLAKTTPTERLRSFDKRTTVYTTTRSITPTRTRSIEDRKQESKRLADKSIRQQVEAQQEEEPFGDMTGQHQNQGNAALFQSWRKSPKRERRSKVNNKNKKKGLTLFEHGQQAYEERDRRRLEAIVHTVRSLEASNFDAEENSSSIPDAESDKEKMKEDESWDVKHFVSGEILNAGLEAVEHFRDVSKDENDINPSNHSPSDGKPIGNTVTDWGIDAIVSDLSFSSNGMDQGNATTTIDNLGVPVEASPKPATSVTQKIQQALADAKNQIYPNRFDAAPEKSCLAAVNRSTGLKDPCSISTTGEGGDKALIQNYATDYFDKAARQRQREERKSPHSSLLPVMPQRLKNTLQPQPRVSKDILSSDRNAVALQNETPKHSNTQKAKLNSFEPNPGSVQRARSKSPESMLALGSTNMKSKPRSRSRTPDGLRLGGAKGLGSNNRIRTPDRVRSLLDNSEPRTPIPLVKVRSNQPFGGSGQQASSHIMKALKSSLPIGRSRSVTPTRDVRPQETPSAASSIFNRSNGSQSRSLTPNRLWPSRQRSMPGMITMEKSIEFTDRAAEERLMEIQRQRSKQRNSPDMQQEYYQRPKITPGRAGGIERGFMGSDGRLFLEGGGTNRSRSPLGLPQMDRNDSMYGAASRSPRDPTSKRWFGRHREEVPIRSPIEVFNPSLSSSTRASKGKASRFNSMLVGSNSGNRAKRWGSTGYSDTSRDTSMFSERMMKQMMTFDSLMKAIENDKKNSLGAEFAVVELGDEENAVQTHAILMNRDDVEGQLSVLGTKEGGYP